jgi:hypothetical protein
MSRPDDACASSGRCAKENSRVRRGVSPRASWPSSSGGGRSGRQRRTIVFGTRAEPSAAVCVAISTRPLFGLQPVPAYAIRTAGQSHLGPVPT